MITVVILARNEQKNLASLLPALSWANSILVIDDNSTDSTKAICQDHSVTYICRPLNQDFAGQRNFALSLVQKGWVLFVDPDERLDEQLVQAIQRIAQQDENHHLGYQVHRQDFFGGKLLRHGEAGGIWLTRLAYHTTRSWKGRVHETWDIPEVKQLTGTMTHNSHASMDQLFQAVHMYASIRAQELHEQGKLWSIFEQITYPIGKFIWNYVIRLGWLDGWQGFVMAVAMSWHSWLVRFFLWGYIPRMGKYIALMPWLLLPWGQLTRVEFGSGAWYGFELFMGLTILWWVITRQKVTIPFPNWGYALMGLTIAMGVSYILSIVGGKPWTGGLYWARWLLYVGYFAILWQGSTSWFRVSWAGIIRFMGVGLLAGGWLQYVFMPDMRWLRWFGWDDHYFRMIGLLFDPNFMGIMLLLYGIWIWLREQNWLKWSQLILVIGALIATYSRMSMLLLGLLLIFIVLQRRLWKYGLAGSVIGILIWVILPKPGGEGVNILRQFSISTRLQTWEHAGALFRSHPLFGIGFNQYMYEVAPVGWFGVDYHPSAPDNAWLFILATTGVVGMGCFIWLLVSWFRGNGHRVFTLSLLVVLLHSMANNTFFYPWVLMWLGLLLLENQEKSTRKQIT